MVEQEREGKYVLIYLSQNGHVVDSDSQRGAGMTDYVSCTVGDRIHLAHR